MREPLSNIGAVCDHHAPKPKPEYLALPLEHFLGGFVKLGFPFKNKDGTESKEHMWVSGIKKNEDTAIPEELWGYLNNDPIRVDLKCGAVIAFSRAEIEDFLANKS